MKEGTQFNACGNTMTTFKIKKEDLPAGTIVVEQGGVVRLAQLQEKGYSYIRP
jgi:uncharacterized protein